MSDKPGRCIVVFHLAPTDAKGEIVGGVHGTFDTCEAAENHGEEWRDDGETFDLRLLQTTADPTRRCTSFPTTAALSSSA